MQFGIRLNVNRIQRCWTGKRAYKHFFKNVSTWGKCVARILQWGSCVGGMGAEPSAAENFCIFYLNKVNFSAFNCIICCNNVLYIMYYTNTKYSGIVWFLHDIDHAAVTVCYAAEQTIVAILYASLLISSSGGVTDMFLQLWKHENSKQ